jgi:hypothetical protein
MWSQQMCCGAGDEGVCDRDRRFCLAQGWHKRRRADGGSEIRFSCPMLELRLHEPRSGAVAWTLATHRGEAGFVVRERGYTRRFLDAARDLADALQRARLAGRMTADGIAAAIVVADSLDRHADEAADGTAPAEERAADA